MAKFSAESMVEALTPARRILFATVSLSIGIAVALAAGEAGARWWERRLSTEAADARPRIRLFTANSSGRGSYRLLSHVDETVRVGTYDVTIHTNSHGMRWREVEYAKPAGKERIAFLGDSFTFGSWAASIEQSFVGVFEDNVSRRRYEVLNFGVGGYGLADQELLLQEEVVRFSPDYLILMIFNGNDFRETYFGLSRSIIRNGVAQMDPRTFAALVPPEYAKSDFVVSKDLGDRSRITQALRRHALYRLSEPLLGLSNRALEFRPSRRFTSYTFWSGHPYPEVARRAVAVSLDCLGRIHAWARRRRMHLAVATIPTRDQVYSERESGPDFDIALPQMYVRLYARERNIAFLDLLPVLREDARRRGRELYLEAHLNNAGHELVGRAVADWFRSEVRPVAEATAPDRR